MMKNIVLSIAAASAFAVAFAVNAGPQDEERIHASPGKPQHPIQVEFDLEGKAQAGVEMPVDVRIHSGMPLTDIRVNAAASRGMLLAGQAEQYLQKSGEAAAEHLSYRLTPTVEGMHELVLTIRARHGERTWTREVTLKVATGDAEAEKADPVAIGRTVKAEDGALEQRVTAKQRIINRD